MLNRLLHRTRVFLFVLPIFFLPLSVTADVSFSEIMYDVAGSDNGREWIEIHNTGASLDLTHGKFFEEGVNHTLTPLGSGVVPEGALAIIVADAAVFRADWPDFAGILFDSSFSLKNTGENLALKNASSTVLASVSYDATKGASGDGNSLNVIEGHLVPRRPTPGSFAAPEPIVPSQKALAVRNLPLEEVVGNTDAIEAGGEAGEAVLAAPVIPPPMEPQSGNSDTTLSFLPWVVGLAAVIGVGITAVCMLRPKKRESRYTIVEDKT